LITDPVVYSQPLEGVARAAEAAGVDYFQLRDKRAGKREMLRCACAIRPHLQRTKMIVNGHLDVAIASGADGVHLQKENLPVGVVREKYPALLIGYSAHDFEEIVRAESDGADFVFVSPVFPSRTKQNLQSLGVDVLGRWTENRNVPIFGLGGVDSANLYLLKSAGCSGAAGISLFVRDGHFDATGMTL